VPGRRSRQGAAAAAAGGAGGPEAFPHRGRAAGPHEAAEPVDDASGSGRGPTAILVGAGLSYWISPSLAFASAAAFLFSETADFLVYTPLARRGWTIAATCGAVVGAAIDSLIFLQLAFHDLSFWKGQFVGKLEMAFVAIVIWALVERWVRAGGGGILAEAG